MTSYGHGYYTYLRKQKVRAFTRCIKSAMDFGSKKDDIGFQYATEQHFNYLYYKFRMKAWRKTMKSKALLKKAFRGKIT